MSRYQNHKITFGSPTSRPIPISGLPFELLSEIFKVYAASDPKVLDRRVVDLCLVGKYWNTVANATPELWTKINLSLPSGHDHLTAATKRVHASKTEKIDVSIEFRYPKWDGEGKFHNGTGIAITNTVHGWVEKIMGVLNGTQPRWKSIRVVSDAWLPLHQLMGAWTSKNPLSLESISMTWTTVNYGHSNVRFGPEEFDEPMTLFGLRPLKLRDLSLCGVHVNWNNICDRFQNLRKLELRNQTYDAGPSFEQFAEMLSSSPRLECLDVSGFCPERHTGPPPPADTTRRVPVVHLPTLKEFTFGWKNVELGCKFLGMFQIGSSLESLTLLDVRSGLACFQSRQSGERSWDRSSEWIFEGLHRLGIAAPRDERDVPPRPFICMRGVKRLKIVWTKARVAEVVEFLGILTGLEDIKLGDVDNGVLNAVTKACVNRAREGLLRRVDLGWMWERERGREIPIFAKEPIQDLLKAGVEVSLNEVDRSEEW